jgi:hypothetical protein
MSKIKLVGLEVEGGWNGTPLVAPFPEMPIIADHSVDGRTVPPNRPLETVHKGEITSKPMEPDMKLVGKWIDKYWPHDVNNTCGYHIHTSFSNLKDYSILTTKSFLNYTMEEMENLAKKLKLPSDHLIWERLAGKNPFSLLNFDGSSQIKIRRKQVGDRIRYGALNFCWGVHGTFEFRALPAFSTKDHAKVFTEKYLDAVETFLKEARPVVSFSSSLVDDGVNVIQLVKGRK